MKVILEELCAVGIFMLRTLFLEVRYGGGAIHCDGATRIIFNGNSNVAFNNNEADNRGAMYCEHLSDITFNGS